MGQLWTIMNLDMKTRNQLLSILHVNFDDQVTGNFLKDPHDELKDCVLITAKRYFSLKRRAK